MQKIHTLQKGDLVKVKAPETESSKWIYGNIDSIVGGIACIVIDCLRIEEGTPAEPQTGFNAKIFSEFAYQEARKKLKWRKGLEASKYTKAFESVLGSARFPWCAAFVHWCVNNYDPAHALNLPVQIPGHNYTLALCEQWDMWAREQDWCISYDIKTVSKDAVPGDLVMFDWDASKDDWDDHMGVYLSPRSSSFLCAEGNTSNSTDVKVRHWRDVSCLIRIPEGWYYQKEQSILEEEDDIV